MEKVGLSEEIKNLELIIDDLAAGREECEISDPQNTLEDALEFLRDYLQELKDLDQQIAENENTPEMLKAVHDKYSELWVFQLMCTVQSLPRVIGPLMRYPKPYESW